MARGGVGLHDQEHALPIEATAPEWECKVHVGFDRKHLGMVLKQL